MSRSTRSRPARRFAVRTALVLVAIGIASHALLVQTVDAELERQLRFRAEFVTEYLLAPAASGDTLAAEALDDLVANPRITSVTVRRSDGAAIASAGTPSADATDVTHEVPVPGSDGLVATITQDDAVVQAAATQLTRRLTLVLGAGLLVLWLVIVPLAYRLGRELRGQADELREQSRELQRLLDQEHLTVQRLREIDEMRDRFLESISHELRTPITVVQGSLQMLASKSDHLSADARKDLANRAFEKSQRLSALVQGLLDLNASAETPQQTRWVDLRVAIESASRALPPRPVELDFDVEGIVTDRGQLVRALGALLGNVIRHAPGEDPMVVRARRRGDDVELQVDDRGPGIPAGLREEVFQPFRQGDLLDAHSPGTGIGLALVAAYAAQHNGRAWVSDRPGGGARLHLLLTDVVGDPADWPDTDPADDDDGSTSVITPVVADARNRPTPADAGGDRTPDAPDEADEPDAPDEPDEPDESDEPAPNEPSASGSEAAEKGATGASRAAPTRRVVRRRRQVVRRTVTPSQHPTSEE